MSTFTPPTSTPPSSLNNSRSSSLSLHNTNTPPPLPPFTIAPSSPITQSINDVISNLLTSCILLFEKIQIGCDNNVFLQCVRRATEETQRTFNFVKNLPTPQLIDKELLLNDTIALKNVVINIIKVARQYHKSVPFNTPAVTPQQLMPLRAELRTAVVKLQGTAHRVFGGGAMMGETGGGGVDVATTAVNGGGDGSVEDVGGVDDAHNGGNNCAGMLGDSIASDGGGSGGVDSSDVTATDGGVADGGIGVGPDTSSSLRGSGASAGNGPGAGTDGGGDSDVCSGAEYGPPAKEEIAVQCLQAFVDMSHSIQTGDRDSFNITTQTVIGLVNKLVISMDPLNKELFALRQNLVSLISHSKMYFVNPDDDYIKNTFFMFKEKVERDITSLLPEGYPINLKYPTTTTTTTTTTITTSDNTATSFPLSPSLKPESPPIAPFRLRIRTNSDKPEPEERNVLSMRTPYSQMTDGDIEDEETPSALPRKTSGFPDSLSKKVTSSPNLSVHPSALFDGSCSGGASGGDLTPTSSTGAGANVNILRKPFVPKNSRKVGSIGPKGSGYVVNIAPLQEAINKANSEGVDAVELSTLDEIQILAPTPPPPLPPPPQHHHHHHQQQQQHQEQEQQQEEHQHQHQQEEQQQIDENQPRENITEGQVHHQTSQKDQHYEKDKEMDDSEIKTDSEEETQPQQQQQSEPHGQVIYRTASMNQREADTDNEFTINILELCKSTWSKEWEALDTERVTTFEQGLHGRILAYKKNVLSITSPVAKQRIDQQIKIVHTNSTLGLLTPKPTARKQPVSANRIFTRSDTKKPTLYRDLKDDNIVSKQITDTVCSIIGDIYKAVSIFGDNGKSYIKSNNNNSNNNDTKTKSEPRNEKKEKDISQKLNDELKFLSERLKESVESVRKNYCDSGSVLELVRNRINESLNVHLDRPPQVFKVDENFLSRGQYLRFTKQQLLRSFYFKAETIFYCTSQFLAIFKEFVLLDVSYSFQLLCIGNIFAQIIASISDDIATINDLTNQEVAQKNQPKKKAPKNKVENSIWKEKDEGPNQEDIYRAGTLNQLILRVTEKAIESEFLHAFFAGCDLFSDSRSVWSKMEERYFAPKEINPDDVRFIKMRVAKFILRWLQGDLYTIDTSVLASIEKFCEKTLKKDKFQEISSMIKKELDVVDRFAPFGEKEKQIYTLTDTPTSIPLYGLINRQTYEIFLCGDIKDIAEQITILEFDIYSRINKVELISQKWSKEKYQVLARNVTSLVQRSDKLSHFVASSILFQKKLKDRKKVLSRVIRIAEALAEMKNYNGLMGILMGLTLSSVARLKYTWMKLSQKYDLIYKTVSMYQDPSNSFKFYRDQLKVASLPCLPYLCMFLSDLTFMEEGNPDFIDDEKTIINFPKHYLVNRTVRQLLLHQSTKFEFEMKHPLFTYLHQLPALEEKELYALSLEREPRDVSLKELELKDKKD